MEKWGQMNFSSQNWRGGHKFTHTPLYGNEGIYTKISDDTAENEHGYEVGFWYDDVVKLFPMQKEEVPTTFADLEIGDEFEYTNAIDGTMTYVKSTHDRATCAKFRGGLIFGLTTLVTKIYRFPGLEQLINPPSTTGHGEMSEHVLLNDVLSQLQTIFTDKELTESGDVGTIMRRIQKVWTKASKCTNPFYTKLRPCCPRCGQPQYYVCGREGCSCYDQMPIDAKPQISGGNDASACPYCGFVEHMDFWEELAQKTK